MANKGVIVGIVILVAVVVVAAVLINRGGEPPSVGPGGPAAPVEQPGEKKQVLETTYQAIQTGNLSECDKLVGDERIRCEAYTIMYEAQAALNYAPCSQIADDYWQTNCRDQVTLYRALDAGNPAICSEIIVPSRVDICRSQVTQ